MKLQSIIPVRPANIGICQDDKWLALPNLEMVLVEVKATPTTKCDEESELAISSCIILILAYW